jgi:dGTPase
VHDLEDGLVSGYVTPAALRDPEERLGVCRLTQEWYAPDADLNELAEIFGRLLDEPLWPGRFDGGLSDAALSDAVLSQAGLPDAGFSGSWPVDAGLVTLAALKRFTSALIGRFCRSAQEATREAYGCRAVPGARGREAAQGRYSADLVVPRTTRLECALLKGVTGYYVMSREAHHAVQARQRETIAALGVLIMNGAPGTLEPALRPEFENAADDAGRLRVVVDQIASLTDASALAWHRRLSEARSSTSGGGPRSLTSWDRRQSW